MTRNTAAVATKQALEQLAKMAHKRRAMRPPVPLRAPAPPSAASRPKVIPTEASVSLESRKKYWGFWKELLELEWAEEERTIHERLREWPLTRLQKEGLCITELRATWMGPWFQQSRIRLHLPTGERGRRDRDARAGWRERTGRHSFQSGDEVLLSRQDPLEPGSMRAEVVAVADEYIDLALVSLPLALSEETWRLDQGANRTSHMRTLEGLADFVSDRFDGPTALRNAVISQVVSTASLKVRSTDGSSSIFDKAAREAISASISISASSSGGQVRQTTGAAASLDDEASGLAVTPGAVASSANITDAVDDTDAAGRSSDGEEHSSRRVTLNTSQRRAIKSVFGRHLTLIQGPPGTGKTRAACELLHAACGVNESGRPLLACGPSNAAVRGCSVSPGLPGLLLPRARGVNHAA